MGEYMRDRAREFIEAVASVDADGKTKVNEDDTEQRHFIMQSETRIEPKGSGTKNFSIVLWQLNGQYVTHFYTADNNSTFEGHYHGRDLTAAVKEFAERCESWRLKIESIKGLQGTNESIKEDDAAKEDKYSPPELSNDMEKDEKGNVVSIKTTWTADDVRSQDDTLTDEQVSDVLRLLVSEHDATVGINWDTIQYWINHVKEGKD